MSTVISSSRNQGYYHEIKSLLVENDPIFADLEAEKRLGWESKDVERLWQLRTQKLNLQNERKAVHNKPAAQQSENPFAALASDGEDEEEPNESTNANGQKVLRAAGKGPSYDKYYSFYRELFSKADKHRSVFSVSEKRFMDIGCAPGGLCAYFIRDLGWSGVGFTLQLERGGLKVRFRDPALEVFPCDMSEPESVSFINEQVSGSSAKFDFINCGVVMGKHQVESIGEDRETAIQILRVNRNQFLVALKWLAKGGDLFWVFQSSNIGCWFYFLNKLQKCFKKPIALFSTLVPSRSPVYALCSDFDADSSAVKEWIAELESATEFTEHHLETWNVKTWQHAKPILESMKDEIYKIWTTQTTGLREIREAASSQLEKEELLLKKLSGSINATMNVPLPAPEVNSNTPSRTHTRTTTNDNDWRRREGASSSAPAEDDGWQVAAKPVVGARSGQNSYRKSGGGGATGNSRYNQGSSSKSSLIDDDDNWRR